MNSITSVPRPLCGLCNAQGTLVQTGIADPDGNLAGTWDFQRCSACGVYWLDPAPVPEEIWKAYATYHTHTGKYGNRAGRALLSLAHRFIKLGLLPVWMYNGLKKEADYLRFMTLKNEPVGSLLDIGCGGGRLLKRMKKRGWQVEGIDFDAQATAKVTQRYGIKTHVGDITQCALPTNRFDVICMSQTIEHLYEPAATLQECLRILKPGGLLVVTTPNAESIGAAEFGAFWRGWEAPRHLHLFTVKSLQQITLSAGFEIDEARTYTAGSAVVYRVSRTLQQAAHWSCGRPAKSASAVDELGLLVWSYRKELLEYREQNTHPNTGQNILIRARKPR